MSRKITQVITIMMVMTFSTISLGAPESFKDIVKKVNPAVVYIEISKEVQGRYNMWGQQSPQDVTGSGSGAIIDAKNGYILTAAHVIDGVDKATVSLLDGREFEATELLYDSQTDVGLVKIDIPEGETLPEIKLGSSEELEVGDWVLAMGSPLEKPL